VAGTAVGLAVGALVGGAAVGSVVGVAVTGTAVGVIAGVNVDATVVGIVVGGRSSVVVGEPAHEVNRITSSALQNIWRIRAPLQGRVAAGIIP
jgi:hypothetical protein